MRENSSSFFANTACRYYPCHTGIPEINCLFCYCPLYFLPKCPGTYTWLVRDAKRCKDCMNCTYPHVAEHYGEICRLLGNAIWQTDPTSDPNASQTDPESKADK